MGSSSRDTASDQHDTFVQWMRDHRGIIVKIVRSFTQRTADAEDLTQEIELALWRSIPSFRSEAKASTWIWRIALNRAISWQRSADNDHLDLDRVAEPAAAERAEQAVLLDRIYEAIRSLRPIDRSLIVLSLEGHSYAEIAEIVGLTETNVGARLSRTRRRLADLLEESP
jgi:RNA polymerase sigma-70 factor (ECF subfamily)